MFDEKRKCYKNLENNKVIKLKTQNRFKANEIEMDILLEKICENIDYS